MARNILILGASYGSLLATKLLMAGHNVTLVCRDKTAALINSEGTEVRIKLRDEDSHRSIFSRDLPGKLDATTPAEADPSKYDLVGLAMQEPQYANHTIRVLMIKLAEAKGENPASMPAIRRMAHSAILVSWLPSRPNKPLAAKTLARRARSSTLLTCRLSVVVPGAVSAELVGVAMAVSGWCLDYRGLVPFYNPFP